MATQNCNPTLQCGNNPALKDGKTGLGQWLVRRLTPVGKALALDKLSFYK